MKIEILSVILLTSFLSFNAALAQDDCSKIKAYLSEKEIIIVNQKKEIDYYKEALQLRESKNQLQIEHFVFKINKVTGDKTNRKLIVEGVFENIGVESSIQIMKVSIVDPKGNNYESFDIKLGGNAMGMSKTYNGVPIKFKLTFEKINEEFPVIKALILEKNDSNSKGIKIDSILKNIDVTWIN